MSMKMIMLALAGMMTILAIINAVFHNTPQYLSNGKTTMIGDLRTLNSVLMIIFGIVFIALSVSGEDLFK